MGMTSTSSSAAQLDPLGGQYVSRSQAPATIGSYVGSTRGGDMTVGSYVSHARERNLAVGRYTRSQLRGVVAWTTAIRTHTGSIVTRRVTA